MIEAQVRLMLLLALKRKGGHEPRSRRPLGAGKGKKETDSFPSIQKEHSSPHTLILTPLRAIWVFFNFIFIVFFSITI